LADCGLAIHYCTKPIKVPYSLTPFPFAAAAVANIKAYNGFFKENGVIVYLATPNDDSDLTYKAYKDNDLIDGVVVVPGMYEDDGGKQIAAAVKKSGIQLGV
jgi:hypothetical protein